MELDRCAVGQAQPDRIARLANSITSHITSQSGFEIGEANRMAVVAGKRPVTLRHHDIERGGWRSLLSDALARLQREAQHPTMLVHVKRLRVCSRVAKFKTFEQLC